MELKPFMFGILIFSMTVTTLVFFCIGRAGDNDSMFSFYNTSVGEEYEPVYTFIEGNIESELNRSDEMRKGVEEAKKDPEITQYISLLTDTVINVIKMPIASMWGVLTTASIISQKLHVPTFIINTIYALIITSISLALLNWYFGRRYK